MKNTIQKEKNSLTAHISELSKMRLKIEQCKVRILQNVMQINKLLVRHFKYQSISQRQQWLRIFAWLAKKPVAKRYVYKTAIDACIEVCWMCFAIVEKCTRIIVIEIVNLFRVENVFGIWNKASESCDPFKIFKADLHG